MEKLIDDLSSAVDEFLVPLRMGEGFSKDKFQVLCSILKECADEWASKDYVPKIGVAVLIDLWPAVEACSYLYKEEDAELTKKASDTLGDLVRECFQV